MPAGGARSGAGRPSKPVRLLAIDQARYDDPLLFLMEVMNDAGLPSSARVRAATAALPYFHPRHGNEETPGKKAIADAQARTAARGTPWEKLLNLPRR